ncbi:MAG: hypothetical protein IPL42_06315 [Saprospiraceae bacterium]|nr:hypothetical protein [Saprospiraceae bacterium]
MKKVLTNLMLAVILIGLPLFAWYYLDSGTKMRKEAMLDLEPKAEMGNFQSVTDQDSLFYSESLIGKRWIIGLIGADSLRAKSVEILKNVYKQAKEEFSINMYSMIGLYPGELIGDMSKNFSLSQDRNWIKTYMAEKHIYIFGQDAFSIPDQLKNKDLIIFLDEFGKIRNYYDLTNPEQVKHMARQVPVFLSLK